MASWQAELILSQCVKIGTICSTSISTFGYLNLFKERVLEFIQLPTLDLDTVGEQCCNYDIFFPKCKQWERREIQ